MNKLIKPENLFISRKRGFTAFAAIAFIVVGLFFGVAGPIALFRFPPEDIETMTVLCIFFPMAALLLIFAGIMNIRNLFFPYLLTTDENGIYNYSGLFHYGFISWQDIEAFSKNPTVFDFLGNGTPGIRIYVRNPKDYKPKLSFGKKWLLFWGCGSIKIHTLCSQIKRRQICGLLENAHTYYAANDENKVLNER